MGREIKVGVLLLAFGGADSIENVEPFVRNVLKNRPVTPELLEKARERYRLIGGKSPLLDITRAQASAVEEILKGKGLDWKVYVGMRYWAPYIKDTLEQMKADGVNGIVTVIMSTFCSLATTGAYELIVEKTLRDMNAGMSFMPLHVWHINPSIISAVAGKINDELPAFQDKNGLLIIFSVHSLPLMALEGDPYDMMVYQCAEAVISRIGKFDYKIAYQSKGGGPAEWKGPSTEEVIEGAKKAGKTGVLVVPLGFVADHIETLYDIDILFKGLAEQNGLVFRRSASLNTTTEFIEMVAEQVIKHGERL